MQPTFDYSASVSGAPLDNVALAAIMVVAWIIAIVVYLYQALCLYKIAKKTGTQNAWLAWIPIAQMFTMLMIAKRPMWWFILMLIPLVNVVVQIIVMIDMLKVLGRPAWWVILMLIPFVNFVIWGIMAFGGKGTAKPMAPKATAPGQAV